GDVQRECAVAGEHQAARCASGELFGNSRVAGRRRQVSSAAVVVGEQLRMVLDALARDLLDPFGRRAMLLRPRGARYLPVCHVPDERVPEREFVFASDRGGSGGADELLPNELAKPLAHEVARGSADRRDRAWPEDLADDGG